MLPVERIERKDENETIKAESATSIIDFDNFEDEILSQRKINTQYTVNCGNFDVKCILLKIFLFFFAKISQTINNSQDDELGEIVDVEFTDTDASETGQLGNLVPNLPSAENWDPTKSAIGAKNRRKTIKAKKIVQRNKQTDDKEATPSALESSVGDVSKRLAAGCECQGVCFKDLQAENVYRHRLNIAELTKQEHDMYLMGVTMACLSNRNETNRRKERIRQRAVYVFQGKRVCLDAFIYLENVTQYHLKRIRRHVMTNGVTPRVHGNVRKKPHNALSLDVYKFAENFVKSELTHYTNDSNKSMIVVNEPRINIYQKFRLNCPMNTKTMSYSTFRHFLKKQFPYVRFVINRPMDGSRIIKQEKKEPKIKLGRTETTPNNVLEYSDDGEKICSLETQEAGMALERDINLGEEDDDEEEEGETAEICVEFISQENDSYESDANEFHNEKSLDLKTNEYQDVDFLESEDE